MASDFILKAEELYFSYEDQADINALNGLSLELRRGERVAVLGANGSGKSTFFLCCNGILRPQKGRLLLNGKPYSYDRKSLLELRRRVGIVFQDPDDQLFSADVEQDISFGILNTGASEEEARSEVDRVIRRLEIEPFRFQPTHALSGGQKKQVAVADILVMHPELMILDEPTAALDPRHRAIVRSIIGELTDQGITVLLSTHDVDYAYEWADQVILFHQGRVLTQGSPEQVFRDRPRLEQAGLEQPMVPAFYDLLVRRGVFSPALPCPRTRQQLEAALAEA